MMEALEYELERYGHDYIRLTTICPMAIATGMFKKPVTRFSSILPILTPEYTAEKAVEAILGEKSLVTIPASTYYAFYLVGKYVCSVSVMMMIRPIQILPPLLMPATAAAAVAADSEAHHRLIVCVFSWDSPRFSFFLYLF